jgi:aldehyde dehydrogenase (NAD+)
VLTSIAEGTAKDVDRAISAAKRAFETSWGLKVPGARRGELLNKLADLMEQHSEELAALEALDNGKTFNSAKGDLGASVGTIRHFGGWADKIHGQVIETNEAKLTYTRHEPIGVVGQIIPWNFPRMRDPCVPSDVYPLTDTEQC